MLYETLLLLCALPLIVCAIIPRMLRLVVVAGLIPAGIEWLFAYRDNLASNGGDWQGGWSLAAFTGFFAALLFSLWTVMGFAGLALGRTARKRRANQ